MGEFHAYMFSVPDWRTDEMYFLLDNREQGIYRNLLDECWVSGWIDPDPAVLARYSRESLEYFAGVWEKIRGKFKPIDGGRKLINPRLEQDRRRLMLKANKHQKRARKAAETRWNKARAENKLRASSNASSNAYAMLADAQTQTHKEENSSIQPLANIEELSPPPARQKRAGKGRPPDAAYDLFAEEHRKATGSAYLGTKGDFVQLAALRRINGLKFPDAPEAWPSAIANYFASPCFNRYTVADLCMRFPVLANSPLDRFKNPTQHANNGKEPSHATRRAETTSHGFQQTAAKYGVDLTGGSASGPTLPGIDEPSRNGSAGPRTVTAGPDPE